MDVLEKIKNIFKQAGMLKKLIYINLSIFFLVFVVNALGFLFQLNSNFIVKYLALPASFEEFIFKPWTVISYGFLHTSFLHILFNLIALYYIGQLFEQFFTAKQLLHFYLLGTLFGGMVFMFSYNFFPVFKSITNNSILLGASAGISAIFIGLATYTPNYELKMPLIGFVKLWVLACIWVAFDLIQLPTGNAGGRLAHIGGAFLGFIYVSYVSNKKFTNYKFFEFFFKKENTLKTVYKSGKKTARPTKKTNKDEMQQKIDAILDKISKSGYETLTNEEKELLFRQGKNKN
ncbi:MAG: rhomboid family intramembrane serine protease [Tenacibaculum sp.]